MRRLCIAITNLLLIILLSACNRGGYGAVRPPPPEPDMPAAAGNDRETYLGLIRTMQERGLFYASLAHIDAYRVAYGDSPELTRLQADALRETDQAAAAMERYRGLVGGAQASAAWHGIGLIEARQEHMGEAVHALDEAVRRDPTNAAYLGDLGYARLRAGDDKGAREPLAKAAELDPSNPKATANLALLFTLEGDDAGAAQLMQRAGLSVAARGEVQRLASDIRRARRDAALRTSQSTAPPIRSVGAPAMSSMAGSLLDRFDTSTTQGHTP